MRKLATLDLETDPFCYGEVPEPFLAGFYDGSRFVSFWGSDCIEKTIHFLARLPEPHVIYWHNGGKFDVFWFLNYLAPNCRIVNGRIIQCHIGEHEFRDSFAIMPFPLDEYQKIKIDIQKLHRDRRNKHHDEILTYLRGDCEFLYELCEGFIREFGDGLTIGGTGMKELKKFHTFKSSGDLFDAKFRKPFYFGGRNQVFKSGIIEGEIKLYDVNSMYSFAMSNFLHPIGTDFEVSPRITNNTSFVIVSGRNDGAFPIRTKNGGLDFTVECGEFSTTIHEFNAAIETGAFRPTKLLKTFGFRDRTSFKDFVEHMYRTRGINKGLVAAAKERGERNKEAEQKVMFYKFALNAPYGKFAQNPANYAEWRIEPFGSPVPPAEPDCVVHTLKISQEQNECTCWSPAFIHHGKFIIWQRPSKQKNYYNVCTGASITGAARSILLRGIKNADRPLYCDTDSLICFGLSGCELSETELGAWKLEGSADMVAIAGKKLYAMFTRDKQGKLTCTKKAHKGARLEGSDIIKIAKGDVVVYENPVPKFRFDGSHLFVKRRIKRTA